MQFQAKPDDERLSETVIVRLTIGDKAKIVKMAKSKGLTITEYVRGKLLKEGS